MSAVFTHLSESNHPEDKEQLDRMLWLEQRRKGVGDNEAPEIGRALEEPIATMWHRRLGVQ